jgi:hypothetical protein
MIVHDDAAVQTFRNVAALFARAIEGEDQARCRMQPVQLASDAIAGLVEMANPGLGHTLADGLVDLAQFSRLLPTQATMLAGQIGAAANKSLNACATRSSGISCWTLR